MRRRRGLAMAAAWLGMLAGRTLAAGPGLLEVRIDTVDPSAFPDLVVKAEVTDQEGRTLRGLEGRHLALYEEDFLLKLRDIHLDKDPISVVLVLDASGTMTEAAEQVKQTAGNLLRLLDPSDHAAMLEFSSEPRLIARFGEPRSKALQALNAFVPYGPTALYDGLYRSLLELGSRSGRRNVVVLSDGKDQNRADTGPGSRHSESEVVELARKMGVTIHAVALGANAMKKELARLAGETQGSAWYAPRPRHLQQLYAKIITRLKGRIVMKARSNKPELDATRRSMVLRVRAGQGFGEARAGYLAPGRWVVDVAPVGWSGGVFGDPATRAVKVKDPKLQELEPGDREALLAFTAQKFTLPLE